MIVFKFGKFTIEKHPPVIKGAGRYTVCGPRGEVIRGNRPSIIDAAVEMDKYNLTGGYERWESVEALVKSKTFYHGRDIDPELREVIGKLNRKGYLTAGSCAGHVDSGFITFRRDFTPKDRRAIGRILSKAGIRVTSWNRNAVIFREVGKVVGVIPFWWR